LFLIGSGPLAAQGTQTGVLVGTVSSSDGAALPGVVVTIKSPALLGVRTTVSDANGGYIFKGLPAGAYTATFELSSFGTLERKTTISIGVNSTIDATLSVASLSESVEVTGEVNSIIETTTGGETYKADTIDTLATPRTIQGIANLAPGLTDNTPNGGQLTISGAFAYDNVFLIDGVDVNDNLFGSPNNVFIEDAIDETQVLTSGISAEYGRFSGGVINAVTKKGGNEFSGSFRTDFVNPSWTTETPFEKDNDITRESKLNTVYQATLGGPIVKDRLWFFAAGRKANTDTQETFDFTGIAHEDSNKNSRIEGKLTGSLSPKHTLQASYTRNNTTDVSPSFDFSIDPRTINESETPNNLFVFNYNGVLRSNLFLEAQYSQQKLEFATGGGSSRDIFESPLFTTGISVDGGLQYNAPYFAFNVDPETRKNRQLTLGLSYFLSTKDLGRHDIKGGWENFRSSNIGGNSQSSTDFVFYADYKTDSGGNPLFDADGNLIPVFEEGQNLFLNWISSPGARIDITTDSFYLNDKWAITSRLSANLGLRYERVRSEATGGISSIDTDTIVPRLGLSFDPRGDGKFTLKANYAHYAGKYSEAQFGSNTKVGNPSLVYGLYVGPSGEGRFAPGFDSNNYFLLDASLPDSNVFFDSGLSSPVTKEVSFAAGMSFGREGFAQLLYTHRKTTNFVEDFFNFDQGTVDVTLPTQCIFCDGAVTLDRRVYRNSDVPVRDYSGLQFQGGYRFTDRWNLQGNWTHQFKYDGNFEGEGANTPGITSSLGDYPEILVEDRNFPTGRLSGYQRDKVRVWTTYDLGLGKIGDLNLGLLYRYDSALTYSTFVTNFDVSDEQLSHDPGYAKPPTLQTLFFGERGASFFKGSNLLDLAATYSVPVYKKLKPYVKFDVRNILNEQVLGAGVNGFNTTIQANTDGPLDANGLPTTFIKSPNFGKATGNNSYRQPRTFTVAVGFRF
jgi:hypothetical protein